MGTGKPPGRPKRPSLHAKVIDELRKILDSMEARRKVGRAKGAENGIPSLSRDETNALQALISLWKVALEEDKNGGKKDGVPKIDEKITKDIVEKMFKVDEEM